MKTKLTFLLSLALFPFLSFGQWMVQNTGFSDSLRKIESIWAVSDKTAWAVAYDGSGKDSIIQEFTKTVNGGTTWKAGKITNATGLSSSMIFALDTSTAWVAMFDPNISGGKIMKTNDGGYTWVHQSSAIFSSVSEAYPNTIYLWNANEGFCMGDPTNNYFEIYTTQNGGALWTRVDSVNMPPMLSGEYGYNSYLSVVDSTVWFGTSKGRIFKSKNKGKNWSLITTPLTPAGKVRFIQFKDTLNGIIGNRVNNSFTMYSTSNGGNTWQAISPSGTVYGSNVVFVDGSLNTFVSIGNATGFAGSSISNNFGQNWTNIPVSTGVAFTALSNFKSQSAWAGIPSLGNGIGGIAKLTIPSRDAGVTNLVEPINPCYGVHPIKVTVKNYGQGFLDSVTVYCELNSIQQTPVKLSAQLAAGQSQDFIIATHNFNSAFNYTLKCFTANPNGLTDTINANDTLNAQISAHAQPVLDLGNDTAIINPGTLTLNAGTIYFTYLWSTGETTQVIVVDSTGMYLENGYKTVWVRVTDAYGCIGTDTIKIHFLIDGISEKENNSSIKLYPNPTEGKFQIHNSLNTLITGIFIYNLTGQLVYSEENHHIINSEIDLSNHADGMYTVKIVTENGVKVSKLVLSKE